MKMPKLQVVLVAALMAACAGCGNLPFKDGKRAVCHKGKTIRVDEAAVAAHIRHGDYSGVCYGEGREGAKESK